jgi:predicted nucleotidyltransferase component of viral defense system
MLQKLHLNTVSPLLLDVLNQLMLANEFNKFRLVGGTALSLQKGHRYSVDIDLFTDEDYDTIDFDKIDNYLRNNFIYVDTSNDNIIGFGKSYFIGKSKTDCVKLDIYYTDKFIDPPLIYDSIRMATISEITAMKLEVILRGGRKKDFWDIHELIENYSPEEMFDLHKKRYPLNHNKIELKNKFTDFANANKDFNPECLKGKHWELIQLDLEEFVEKLN